MATYICSKSTKKYKGIINPKFKTVDMDSSSVTDGAVIEVRHTGISKQGTDNVLRQQLQERWFYYYSLHCH